MSLAAAIVAVGIATGAFLFVSPFVWSRHSRDSSRGEEPSQIDSTVGETQSPGRLRRLLDAAGFVQVASGAFVGLSLVVSLVAFGVVFLLSPVVILAVCAGLIGAGAPAVFLLGRRRRRERMRAGLWPDVADTLISHLRAGKGIVEAVSALAESAPTSIGRAAEAFAQRTAVSGNVTECLRALKAEWADPAGDRIVEALCVTRDVGGTRLTAVLRELSRSLRQELALRREIDARQSWIRVAAGIGAAAPWVVIVLLSMRPEAATAYGSAAGATLVFGGLSLSIAAYQLMIRIGRLHPERRWFA